MEQINKWGQVSAKSKKIKLAHKNARNGDVGRFKKYKDAENAKLAFNIKYRDKSVKLSIDTDTYNAAKALLEKFDNPKIITPYMLIHALFEFWRMESGTLTLKQLKQNVQQVEFTSVKNTTRVSTLKRTFETMELLDKVLMQELPILHSYKSPVLLGQTPYVERSRPHNFFLALAVDFFKESHHDFLQRFIELKRNKRFVFDAKVYLAEDIANFGINSENNPIH